MMSPSGDEGGGGGLGGGGRVSRAFVINMASAKDRWAAVTSQLRREGVSYERVEGLVGKDHRDDARVSPWCKVMCSDGVVGCALSHMQAWRALLASGEDAALVMEDDAVLAENFLPRLNACVAELDAKKGRDGWARGGWDVLLAGCFGMCDKRQRYANPITVGLSPMLRMITRNVACVPSRSAKVFAPEFFWGLHCYVVTRAGARRLLRVVRTVWYHVDFQLNTLPLRIYACSPPLAGQSGFDASSIATSSGAPLALSAAMAPFRDGDGVPYHYYMGVPVARHVNGWTIVFAALGALFALLRRRRRAALALLAAVGATLAPDVLRVLRVLGGWHTDSARDIARDHAAQTAKLVAAFVVAAAATAALLAGGRALKT